MARKSYRLSYMAILEKPVLKVKICLMSWYGISGNTNLISSCRRSSPEVDMAICTFCKPL